MVHFSVSITASELCLQCVNPLVSHQKIGRLITLFTKEITHLQYVH